MSQTKNYYLVSPLFTKVPHLLASGARLLYARIPVVYTHHEIKSICIVIHR